MIDENAWWHHKCHVCGDIVYCFLDPDEFTSCARCKNEECPNYRRTIGKIQYPHTEQMELFDGI